MRRHLPPIKSHRRVIILFTFIQFALLHSKCSPSTPYKQTPEESVAVFFFFLLLHCMLLLLVGGQL